MDIVHRLISKGLGSSRSHGHLLFHRPGTGRAGGPVVVIEDASISCKETMVTAARYGGGRGDRYNVFQGSGSSFNLLLFPTTATPLHWSIC